MMPLIGTLALALALVLAGYSIIANVVGARASIPSLTASARHALWAMCAMVTVAVGALSTSLLHSDFSLEYVASYTSFSLPTIYKITALWGGQQGSLLFWTWLLTIFTSLVAFQNRRRNPDMTPYALAVLAGIAGQSAQNIQRLTLVVTSLLTQMDDAARLRLIDETGNDIDRNYSDLAQFSQQSFLLSVQRARDANDIAVTKALYGIQ